MAFVVPIAPKNKNWPHWGHKIWENWHNFGQNVQITIPIVQICMGKKCTRELVGCLLLCIVVNGSTNCLPNVMGWGGGGKIWMDVIMGKW